jgi:hypothetical protein
MAQWPNYRGSDFRSRTRRSRTNGYFVFNSSSGGWIHVPVHYAVVFSLLRDLLEQFLEHPALSLKYLDLHGTFRVGISYLSGVTRNFPCTVGISYLSGVPDDRNVTVSDVTSHAWCGSNKRTKRGADVIWELSVVVNGEEFLVRRTSLEGI